MQKYFYFWATLFCFMTVASSQSLWFQEGTKFTHNVQQINALGFVETELEGDVEIDGVPCKKFTRRVKLYDFNGLEPELIGDEYIDPIYMYANENDTEVYYYQHEEFKKIYDFNEPVGGIWTLPYVLESLAGECPNNDFMITEKGAEMIDGVQLKWVELDTTAESENFFTGRVYQKIGSTSYYFTSLASEYLCLYGLEDFNYITNFRCMSDDNFDYVSEYVNQNFQGNCEYPDGLSVNDISNKKTEITLYPNPANNQVNVKTSNPNLNSYEILDAIGGTVRSGKMTGNNTTVGIQDLVPGVYFLKFIDKDNKAVKAKKFIKK